MEEERQKLKKIKLPQPAKKLAPKSTNEDSDSVDNNLDEAKTHLNAIDHDKVSDKNPRFEREDFENVVTYLSEPAKFNLIYGSGKKTTVTGQTMNRNTSLNTFATHINGLYNVRHRISKGLISQQMNLSGRGLDQRLIRYKANYMKARKWTKDTGAGISDKDNQRGIFTTAEKKEDICPHFEKMEALFGDKPNVTPFAIFDSGVDDAGNLEWQDWELRNGFGKESEDVDHAAKSTEEGDVFLEGNNNDESVSHFELIQRERRH